MADKEAEQVASPDRPESAHADEPQASDAAPVARRAHRVLVPLLLVLATLIGTVGAFAVWVNRQALNTDNWTSTSGQVLQNKEVQTALSAYLVDQLFSKVDVAGDLKQVLPSQLDPLAGPAAAGLRDLAGTLAPKVLASPQAQTAWVEANKAAHKQLLRVLTGGGRVVSTNSGVVTLNIHQLVDQLAATLGVSSQVAAARAKLNGSSGASAKATVQNKLGITLPSSSGQLVIMRSKQLKTAQDIANGVKHLAIVLPVLAILLFALAVYLARGRRRRTLRTSGWCFVTIGVLLLLIRRVAGNAIVNDLVKVQSNKPAVHDVWNIATSLLFGIAVALIIYGVVVVMAAWLAGPTRPATALRKFLAPELRDSPGVVYGSVGGLLLVVVAWGPTPAFRNIWWILVIAALLALGVTMLRRQTAQEFPGIEHGQAMRDHRASRAAAHGQEQAPPASGDVARPSGGDRVEPPY
jgi:hypothetical protein